MIQQLVHGFLISRFDDIRPEEYTPSYAGGSSRIDFLLKDEKQPLSQKLQEKIMEYKKISEELINDVAYYQQHNDCDSLICFIYDPEYIIQNRNGIHTGYTETIHSGIQRWSLYFKINVD